jgi:peptide/nickel transport system substrate-binding protein
MKRVLGGAAVGALALALTACGGGGGSANTPSGQNFVNGKTFTMVLAADPGNLDPHFTSLAAALATDRFLYDSLTNIDEKGNVVAGLASSWQGTATTATYTLRKNITCSDGAPLTASQIADNINFVGDPKNASSRIGLFVPPGATAKGDDAAGTVTVTSPSPDPFLSRNVGGLQIVCDKGMKDRGLLKQGADGTGLFTLTEAVASDHYTLTRRKDYAWGPGDWKTDTVGLPDTVVIKIVSNETTAANLLLSGGANAISIVGPDRQRLSASNLFHRDVEAPVGELWFNQKAGLPGADEAVRKALTQALDLNQLGQVVTSNSGSPAKGMVAPGGPCPQDTVTSNLPAHNVDAAKSALDAAGWTAGADGIRAKGGQKLSMILYYPTSVGAGMQAGAELTQQVWKDLGVDVTIKAMTDAEAGSIIVAGQGSWNAAFVPLGLTLPTQLVSFVSGATPPNGVNFSYIQNKNYTDNVAAASALPGSDGCDKWAAAESSLIQHVNVVPFVDSTIPTFGKGAQFELSQGSVTPGSIRMLG